MDKLDKLTDRQRQAINTKIKITQVATELFKSKGFDSVKIQDICQAAEISTGAFYHHFKSKVEIINTTYEQIDLLVMDRFKSRKFSSDLEKLLFLIEEGAKFLEELGWVFVSEIYKNLLSIEGKYSIKPDRHITMIVKSIIDDLIEDKKLDYSICSLDLSMTIMRITRGAIFDWCLHQGNYNLQERIKSDLSLIISNFI